MATRVLIVLMFSVLGGLMGYLVGKSMLPSLHRPNSTTDCNMVDTLQDSGSTAIFINKSEDVTDLRTKIANGPIVLIFRKNYEGAIPQRMEGKWTFIFRGNATLNQDTGEHK